MKSNRARCSVFHEVLLRVLPEILAAALGIEVELGVPLSLSRDSEAESSQKRRFEHVVLDELR